MGNAYEIVKRTNFSPHWKMTIFFPLMINGSIHSVHIVASIQLIDWFNKKNSVNWLVDSSPFEASMDPAWAFCRLGLNMIGVRSIFFWNWGDRLDGEIDLIVRLNHVGSFEFLSKDALVYWVCLRNWQKLGKRYNL